MIFESEPCESITAGTRQHKNNSRATGRCLLLAARAISGSLATILIQKTVTGAFDLLGEAIEMLPFRLDLSKTHVHNSAYGEHVSRQTPARSVWLRASVAALAAKN